MMNLSKGLFKAILIGACFVSAALCQTTVEFGITSPGNHVLSGVYTDPYQGYVEAVGGVPGQGGFAVAAFCDDFTDDIFPPQFWNAFVTDLSALSDSNLSPVSTVYYGAYSPTILTPTQQTTDYIAVAMLAAESMANMGNAVVQNQLSFALWDIFYPSLLTSDVNAYGTLDPGTSPSDPQSINTPNWNAALNYATTALAAAATYSSGAAYEAASGYSVTIYTPETNGAVQGIGTGRPQEFITVHATTANAVPIPMPESSGLAVIAFDVCCVAVVGLIFRRRKSRRSVL